MAQSTQGVGRIAQIHEGARELPTQHLSVRVPWHDNGWDGTICQAPRSNASCIQLTSIGQNRDDTREEQLAGSAWNELAEGDLPACKRERASFMAPFSMQIHVNHPYKAISKSHEHFGVTQLDMPAYSANCIPFRWMLRKEAELLGEELQIDYNPKYEERIDERISSFDPIWVQDRRNHLVLLDSFFSAIKPEESLCFFYAKATPLAEDPRRVVVGIGRVTNVGPSTEYEYVKTGAIRSMLWERAIHHSIRPEMTDGFLFPYQALLQRASEPGFQGALEELDKLVAFVPGTRRDQFSYTSEHVPHDVAIEVLLSCDRTLEAIAEVIPGPWAIAKTWIDERLNSLWTLRGPYPGLGSALSAFGVQHGTLLAHEISKRLNEDADPWPLVDGLFRNPDQNELSQWIEPVLSQAWSALSDERHSILRLLSRFDLTRDQTLRFYRKAERESAGIRCEDSDVLANPYLLYELDRESEGPVSAFSIDRGLFPDRAVLSAHPIPIPTAPEGPLDARRVRALSVSLLEAASQDQGHSLLPNTTLQADLNALALQPRLSITEDTMPVVEKSFAPEIVRIEMADASAAYQLGRLNDDGQLIRRTIERRLGGKPHDLTEEWATLLDDELGPAEAGDTEEERARREKTAALEELATSRISLLIGPAGTGKTTLLSVLSKIGHVRNGGILLLAPTGKARVQLEQRTRIRAQTIAQFLLKRGRYKPEVGLYRRSEADRSEEAKTVVIDECSMLTEEQLAATLDALKGVERLILVGDPRQLPPIGTGRPFADIVVHLAPEDVATRFPRVGKSYCELTIPRRQVQGGVRKDSDDLLLASWFSGQDPGPGSDEIWSRLEKGVESESLSLVSWNDLDDLREKLIGTLVRELSLSDESDTDAFNIKSGGKDHEGWIYFNRGRDGQPGSAHAAEAWQILSPLRSSSPGTIDLNRLIKETFRSEGLEFATSRRGRVPKPFGPERIVYGDKVINVVNRRRKYVYPDDPSALKYVANGEIGIAVGVFRRGQGKRPNKLEVEFSSQPGFSYGFFDGEFGDEANSPLELAYVITVHKAQGSEFGSTLLIIPYPCRLLSRELLYTAFTRQQQRLVVLHQGELSDLKRYANSAESETARRLTNLFRAPSPIATESGFLEEGLIHRTLRGELVRSKSEVIIANLLADKGLDYEYESRLIGKDSSVRYPDFTIDDPETGLTVYWEHLGLLSDPSYRRKWEDKKVWYRDQGILPAKEGEGSGGLLVTSADDERGGIDSQQLSDLISETFG